MTQVKLTDHNNQTMHGTTWGERVTHTAIGSGTDLCSDGLIHYYEAEGTPEDVAFLAHLLNPIHADFEKPVAWLYQAETVARDGQLKAGAKSGTTIRKIEIIPPTTEQRIAFFIYCVKTVCGDPAWNTWADGWLDGLDRSAATAAAEAAEATAAERAAVAAAQADKHSPISLIGMARKAQAFGRLA